jgi:hypothetical protein
VINFLLLLLNTPVLFLYNFQRGRIQLDLLTESSEEQT